MHRESWLAGHVARLMLVLAVVLVGTIPPVAAAQPTPATSIQLPDGSVCQYNTTTPAPTFDGQRVTYMCGPAPNNGTKVILGTPTLQDGVWMVRTGVMVQSGSGFDLQSMNTLSLDFTQVRLVDGMTCAFAGSGAATVEGQRLNYTCGGPDTGLLGDISTATPLWMATRVRLAGPPGSQTVTSRESVGIQSVVSQPHGNAPAPTPTPVPTQATSIQLPDGSVCQFAGTGATASFNGQRVNYTCGPAPNNGTNVILGTPTLQNGVWVVTTGVVEPSNTGPVLRSSQTISMSLSKVTLVDNTICTPVAAGTAITVEGQAMNYTCGRAEEGLLGDFDTSAPLWTATKVIVQQTNGTTTVQQRQTQGISSVVGTAAAPLVQATSIQLPDGSVCQFAGTSVTTSFNGQPVSYNCGAAPDGSIIVLLGTPTFQNGALVVQRGVVVPSSSGPSLRSSETLTLNVASVELVDATTCASTGQGATISVEGQRLNYTCGDPATGLVGPFDTTNPLWTAQRVHLVGAPPTLSVSSRDTVGIRTAIGQTSAAPGPPASPTPQPAPPQARDGRYFIETNFRVANDAFWNFFQSRGAEATFGFPVSRQFGFLGCQVQFFQRSIMQQCVDNGPVALLNLLDPELFPYTHVNGSVFPAADDSIKARTPVPGTPGYDQAIIDFVDEVAPDQFQGQPVNFEQTFNETGGLEIWGAPISNPAYDPGNQQFIYQRFQRGIMHYTVGQGTRGILLADYLKAIMLGPALAAEKGSNLPADLDAQAKGMPQYAQYCPGAAGWLCRPTDLPGSDLTYAFEAG